MQLLRVRFHERGFLKLGVDVEVAEPKPIVECHGSEHEHYCERPKIQLDMVVRFRCAIRTE